MRKLFVPGLVGLLVASTTLLVGCAGPSSSSTPKMMEIPKEGPQPVGGGKGAGGKKTVPGATSNSSD